MLKDLCVGFMGWVVLRSQLEPDRDLGHLGHWLKKNIYVKVEGDVKNGAHRLLQPIKFL